MATLSDQEIKEIKELLAQDKSYREIARIVLGRESRKSTIGDFVKRQNFDETFEIEDNKEEYKGAKIFVGDVETSASIVYSFSRFKAFIKPDQVIQEPYLLTVAGKWLHNEAILSYKLPDYDSFKTDVTNDHQMMVDLWDILDECDIFVAHNAKFDVGWLNQRFAYWGMKPPSPYKVIDTLKEIKLAFTLPARSLAASANYFELPNRKLDNAGWSLWQRCMEGDETAFDEMETYNIGDITSLQDLYLKVRPWMKTHPNVTFKYDDGVMRCPKSGSANLVKVKDRKYSTLVSEYDLYYCPDSQSYCRGRKNIRTKDDMQKTLIVVG